MTDELVLLAHDGPVSTLTINRPDALNSLNAKVLLALAAAIDELATRSATRCAIVTGAGDKAFVAGADIAAMSTMSASDGAAFARLGQSTFAALEALPMPVIAAVNGFALRSACTGEREGAHAFLGTRADGCAALRSCACAGDEGSVHRRHERRTGFAGA